MPLGLCWQQPWLLPGRLQWFIRVWSEGMAMSQHTDERSAGLRELLQHHWEHCRHLESERSWFMNAYAVVIGGVAALLIGGGMERLERIEGSPLMMFLGGFLVVLTFVGYFHTVRWTYAFECHRTRVNHIATLLYGNEAPAEPRIDPTMSIPAMRLPLSSLKEVISLLKRGVHFCKGSRLSGPPEKPERPSLWQRVQNISIGAVFRTRYWFPALYLATLGLFTWALPSPLKWLALGCLLVSLWLGAGFLVSRPE